MILGAASSQFASLQHHSTFGHELAVAASTKNVTNDGGGPGWGLNEKDNRGVILFFTLAGTCWLSSALVIVTSAVIHRLRLRAKANSTENPLPACPGIIFNQPQYRQIGLILIGFSPLLTCFCVGEYYENVIIAMVLMHNFCMMLLPSLYYALRSYADPDSREETSRFYRIFWRKQCQGIIMKVFRGIFIGTPIFFMLAFGYLMFNCRTAKWFLCVHRFEKGLEENGLKRHSLAFRCIGLLYFTFINPFYEEFFWRVFLHREWGLARLSILEESKVEIQGWATNELNTPASAAIGAMDLISAEVDDDKDLDADGNEITPDSYRAEFISPTEQGACHELVDKIKIGWSTYCYAFSFHKEEDAQHSGLRAAVWQSFLLRWGISMMYASYHMWPVWLIFRGSVIYAIGGFFVLTVLGRGFLLLRECRHFGIVSAILVHICVDAAFSAICLYEF